MYIMHTIRLYTYNTSYENNLTRHVWVFFSEYFMNDNVQIEGVK